MKAMGFMLLCVFFFNNYIKESKLVKAFRYTRKSLKRYVSRAYTDYVIKCRILSLRPVCSLYFYISINHCIVYNFLRHYKPQLVLERDVLGVLFLQVPSFLKRVL